MRKDIFSSDYLLLIYIYSVEYVNIVCNNCKQYESNDPVQNETVRIVSGAIKLASFNSNLTEMGWETLGSRITHKLTIPDKKRNAPVRTVQRR